MKRAEEKPTAQNIQVLEGELINQMQEYRAFADQLQALIQPESAESPFENLGGLEEVYSSSMSAFRFVAKSRVMTSRC